MRRSRQVDTDRYSEQTEERTGKMVQNKKRNDVPSIYI